MTSEKIAAHFSPGTHGSTFGGNPLACAVGQYVVDTLTKPAFLQDVRDKGEFLRTELKKLAQETRSITEVRGRGLLIGAELADAYKAKASEIQKLCFKHGLLILLAGHDVLRFAPALNISKDQLLQGLVILKQVLNEIKQ